MKNFLNIIKNSFIASTKGQEKMSVVIWGWGCSIYVILIFIINKLLQKIDIKFFYISISILVIIYLIWHIYVLIKCFPKSPKLTKEEKEQLKIQRGGAPKVFFRKFV